MNLKERISKIPYSTKRFSHLMLNISTNIDRVLKSEKLSQREFAIKVGHNESEISKWLSGSHNFTLKTIAKIESVLGYHIINLPIFHENKKVLEDNKISHSINTLQIEIIEEQNNFIKKMSESIKNYAFEENNQKYKPMKLVESILTSHR